MLMGSNFEVEVWGKRHLVVRSRIVTPLRAQISLLCHTFMTCYCSATSVVHTFFRKKIIICSLDVKVSIFKLISPDGVNVLQTA